MRSSIISTGYYTWAAVLLVLVFASLARADSIEIDEADLDIQRPKSFIVNGTDAEAGRYPYYTSLRYWKNSTGELYHFCGASLISDRLVLTAAHCVFKSRPALPDDFESLALNFTSFPNTEMWEGEVYAYIGAMGEDVTGIEPNIIEMFFVHPQWDGNLIYADVAVGLLTEPVSDVPKVQVLSSKTDIYDLINPDTQSLFAIGLGRYINKEYSVFLQQSHLLDHDVNEDPNMKLQEANVGTLLPRTLCGKLYTAGAQHLSNDGSGNLEYRETFTPRVIPESQVCVAPITDDETDVYIKGLVQYIAEEILLNSTSDNLDAVEATRANLLDKISFYAAAYNGVCQGDSGGPILLKGSDYSQDIQIGIGSYTYGCGSKLGFVASNVQAFLQDSSGFDSFLVDLLNRFPDQASQMRLANSVAAIPQSVAVSG